MKRAILSGFFILVCLATAWAGDATVEVNLEQSILIDSIEVESRDGEAKAYVGGVVAGSNSRINAEVKSEIKIRSLKVSTGNGRSVAMIGSVVAGD